jgi:hypothetical protein
MNMGVRRLFSRGGQKFSPGGGQEPPLPSPADAHVYDVKQFDILLSFIVLELLENDETW